MSQKMYRKLLIERCRLLMQWTDLQIASAYVRMLSKTGPNYVFSLPHVHLLWTLTAPQVTFKNNASFVYISNNSHFSFKLKKAKYFCMLLAEFHN